MDSKVIFGCPLLPSCVQLCNLRVMEKKCESDNKKEKKVACGSGFRAFSCYAVGAVSFILCPDLG